MSKLEELRAAFAASTPGQWNTNDNTSAASYAGWELVNEDATPWCTFAICLPEQEAKFIALAHNMMPALLEAVKALDFMSLVVDSGGEADEGSAIALMRAALAKLT